MKTLGALLATARRDSVVTPDDAVPDERGRERLGCGSGTHGSAGYAYAGFESARVSSGVRATDHVAPRADR